VSVPLAPLVRGFTGGRRRFEERPPAWCDGLPYSASEEIMRLQETGLQAEPEEFLNPLTRLCLFLFVLIENNIFYLSK
jgi:hypothetical protein